MLDFSASSPAFLYLSFRAALEPAIDIARPSLIETSTYEPVSSLSTFSTISTSAMARFSAALAILAVLATEAAAFPINPHTLASRNLAKRIAQTTIDAPKKWEDACVRIWPPDSKLAYTDRILLDRSWWC